MRLITYAIVFILGAGAGIWWGSQHPDKAADIASKEAVETAKLQTAITTAKIDALEEVLNNGPEKDNARVKKLLEEEKIKLSQEKDSQ